MDRQDADVKVPIDADSHPLIGAGHGQQQQKYGSAGVLVTDTGKGEVQVSLLQGSSSDVRRSESGNQTTVYVQVVFMKIGEIDTVKETFTADVFVQARWREPKLDGRQTAKDLVVDDIKWASFWNPKLYVHNASGAPSEAITRTVLYDTDTWHAYVAERRRVRGTFIENLELFTFPFDTQDITVKIASERSDEEVIMMADPVNVSTITIDMFIDEQEWKLFEEVETHRESIEAIFDGNVARTAAHTAVCCRTHATRRPGFYITNILLVMLFIYSVTFATFAVDYIKRENRLQLAFILLLTTIAFKNSISSSLPRISYFTTMDIYVVMSMTIMILICVWHAIVPSISRNFSESIAKESDQTVLIVLGCLYAACQIVFAIATGIPYRIRKRRQLERELNHKKRIEQFKTSTLVDIRN